jgi:hypothetical protein
LNPIVARALRASVRPRALLGLAGAALLVLASSRGLAPDRDAMPGLRVTPIYLGLCRAELVALLVVATIMAAASIASERQERTWDPLALSALSNTELVLGKAAGVLPPVLLLATFLVPVHLVYGMAWGAPWVIILGAQVVFLGAGVGAAGLSLLSSSACGRVLHAVALAAAAIVLGWFAALDGLAGTRSVARLARTGHPLRLLDDLATSSVSAEVVRLRVLAFLLGAGIGGALAVLAAIALARRPIEGRVLAMPGLFRARPGKTEPVWDDPVYWRECRSRGARRTLRIGGLLLLGLAVVLSLTWLDLARGGLWTQLVEHSSHYENLLIKVGMLMLCLRASATIVDERRRGMLAPLALAGISPAHLVWSKLRAALRPAVLLTAIIVIAWVADAMAQTGRLIDSRLWLDSFGVLAAVGAGYFLAVSLGLLASSHAPSLRVALLVGPALLIAWNAAPQLVWQVIDSACPGISPDTRTWLGHLIGGEPPINILWNHVLQAKYHHPASWAFGWIPVTTLAGVTALAAAIFRVSRELGRPQR